MSTSTATATATATGTDRPLVFVTRNIPSRGVDVLAEACKVETWAHDDPVPRDVLIKRVAGIDGLLCLLTDKIDAEILTAAGTDTDAVLL